MSYHTFYIYNSSLWQKRPLSLEDLLQQIGELLGLAADYSAPLIHSAFEVAQVKSTVVWDFFFASSLLCSSVAAGGRKIYCSNCVDHHFNLN